MDPPPNRQPPLGANGHRKSSSLNRSWFGGTMEVITGMAPRPVTPSQNNNRSASAPNSPARGLGIGLFGGGGRNSPHHNFPPLIDRTNSAGSAGGGSNIIPNFPINRLPSQDSLDRSIHNESGHGKSTAQIIRDLKHSNSSLSAKMASLEKRHMNELAQVEAASSSKRQELEQLSAKQKVKLMQYEQYKAAAEAKMKQQNAELSKVKEESAFQRHSISDLKNQLFQLQQELDEQDEDEGKIRPNNGEDSTGDSDNLRPQSDNGHNLPIAPTSSSVSTEDFQQMALDNEELVKEIQELQDQLMEYQGYDKKLKDLQRQLEVAKNSSNGSSDAAIPPRPTTPTYSHLKNQPERERPPLAPSKSRDQDEAFPASPDTLRKQLQDTRDELERQKQKLHHHESSVRDLKAEKESLTKAHSKRVEDLEEKLSVLKEESKDRESSLRNEMQSLSQKEIDEIETRLREEQQEQVVELEEQLEQYAEKLAEVAATLAESRQQAKNQEQYRKDEAEDLRMIQDAHEAEIVRLEKELDESMKELELRDDELDEIKQKYLSLLQQDSEDEKKIEERKTQGSDSITGAKNSEVLSGLEEQLHESSETVKKLELQIDNLQKNHIKAIEKLENEKTQLSDNLKKLEETKEELQVDKDRDPAGLHRYWEEKTSKTKEVESLKDEIEKLRQRVHDSTEIGKCAEQKVKDLEHQLQNNRSKESDVDSTEQVVVLRRQIASMNEKIEKFDSLSAESEKVKKELEEAQNALIAMDDDKQAMHDEINDLKKSGESMRNASPLGESSLEDIKQNFELQMEQLSDENSLVKTKLKDRDTTIATLLRSSIVLENKIESLQAEIRESGIKYGNVVDELQKLRNIQVSRNEEYSKVDEEIKYLTGQLRLAKVDAKRWRRALKEDGTTSGEYRYQISMLQKANDDFAETIKERDQAIQNLVNQSMGQESHVRDLKIRISSLMKEVESVRMNMGRNEDELLKAEIDRLQEESEIFASQIIEQDEEFKRMQNVLIQRNKQIDVMRAEINSLNQSKDFQDKAILQNRDAQISKLQKKIESLENDRSFHVDVVDSNELINLQAELDEMQEAAESNRIEIRDLRQQLWEAKDAAGSASDLRVQLDQVRWKFEEYKRCNSEEKSNNDNDELQLNLEKALARVKELEEKTSTISSESKGINSMETELDDLNQILQSKDALIDKLLEEIKTSQKEISRIDPGNTRFSKASQLTVETSSSDKNATFAIEYVKVTTDDIKNLYDQFRSIQEESETLRKNLDTKTSRIQQFEGEVNILANDTEMAKQNLEAKSKYVDDLEHQLTLNKTQLKEASDLKSKLGNDLADSQARLSALEKELLNAISETSSDEELSKKNQSLVQDNASLVQKNKHLSQENQTLESANSNLAEESETLTKDNHVLCEEVKALGQQKTSMELKIKSLTVEKQSLDEKNNLIILAKGELNEKVTCLTKEIKAANISHDKLTNDNKLLLEKSNELVDTVENLMEMNKILTEKGTKMQEVIESLQADMDQLSGGTTDLKLLQTKLNESAKQRELSEQTIVEKYEKELQTLSSSKDEEMDSLRKNLVELRERNSEDVGEVMTKLKSMEEENVSLKNQFELEIQAKNQQIFALEHTLHAQEQIVDSMRSEMDQIQSGMEYATSVRRNEVEEMQQEVIQVEAKAIKQEREIVALKMQLEERKLEHKADVVKLKDALAKAMEHDSPLKQTIFDLKTNDRMLEVRERLEQLKARNTQLQEENLNLGGRLERAAIQIGAFEVEKQQAQEIEEENLKLRNQLKEYEQLLSRSKKLRKNLPVSQASRMNQQEVEVVLKARDKKKKKFGLFKKRNLDDSISEGKEEEEL